MILVVFSNYTSIPNMICFLSITIITNSEYIK